MKYTILLLSALTMIGTGCSEYNKVFKSEDYGRKFELANDFFNTGKEERSIALYEQVYQRMPKQAEGELSYFRIGKAYYNSGQYFMAGYYLGVFPQRFPYSPKAEEAMFLSAMCAVNNSPDWSLDQTETEVAINDLQQFINRYPNSQLVDTCNTIIDKLHFKLETKTYEAVKLYAKTENYRAASSSAETFLEEYPLSIYKEEVHYLFVKNSYLLSINSIKSKKEERIEKTIERYTTFVASFPESKYKKELTFYDNEMRKTLTEIKAQKN